MVKEAMLKAKEKGAVWDGAAWSIIDRAITIDPAVVVTTTTAVTSPWRPPKPSGGATAVDGRRRVGRKLRRRPKFPLDPPPQLMDEARPACLLPDRRGHRVQERRSLSGLDRPGELE